MRHLLWITKLDNEKNQSIRETLRVVNIVKEIKQYQQKWLQHVQRMDTNRIPKQALHYRPKRRRNIGRPRKRWRDHLHLEDQETGNTPNPSCTWRWWWLTIISSHINNEKILAGLLLCSSTLLQRHTFYLTMQGLCVGSGQSPTLSLVQVFVMGKAAMKQLSLRVFRFDAVCIIPSILCTDITFTYYRRALHY